MRRSSPQRTKQKAQWKHHRHLHQQQLSAWPWIAQQAFPLKLQTPLSGLVTPPALRGRSLHLSSLRARVSYAQARRSPLAPVWSTVFFCSAAASVALSPPVKSAWWSTWRSTRETSSASSSTRSSSSSQISRQASKQQSESCPLCLFLLTLTLCSHTDPLRTQIFHSASSPQGGRGGIQVEPFHVRCAVVARSEGHLEVEGRKMMKWFSGCHILSKKCKKKSFLSRVGLVSDNLTSERHKKCLIIRDEAELQTKFNFSQGQIHTSWNHAIPHQKWKSLTYFPA